MPRSCRSGCAALQFSFRSANAPAAWAPIGVLQDAGAAGWFAVEVGGGQVVVMSCNNTCYQ
jgi:hypothetical protein